jgi:hypothetical protein
MRGEWVKSGLLFVLGGVAVLMFAPGSFAQEEMPPFEAGSTVEAGSTIVAGSSVEAGSTVEPQTKKPGLVGLPIPIISEVIGNGVGLGGALLFQTDPKSKTSGVGLGGFYTDTGSWGAGGGLMTNFKENKYRFVIGGMFYNLNLDFYGIGTNSANANRSIRITQAGWAVFTSFSAAVAKNFYMGMTFRYIFIDTSLEDSQAQVQRVVDLSEVSLGAYNYGPGLSLTYDSTDSNTNPHSGVNINLTGQFPIQEYTFAREGQGYHKYNFEANFYAPLAENLILAYQIGAGLASDAAPFYDVCGVNIRGYEGGKYRDNTLLVTQMELRWRFYKRLGLVVFGGAAVVNPRFMDFTWGDVLPAGGAGLRINVSKAYEVDLALDYAWGKDDNQVFYLTLGQAF